MRCRVSRLTFLALAAGAHAGRQVDPAEELFRRAERHIIEGDQTQAVTRFNSVVRLHPKSPAAPRALLRIAELYARNREFSEAFDAAQRLIEKYPASDLFARAVEVQFAVSERVMEEYRRRRLKNDKSQRDLPDRASASEMLRVIVGNALQGELAPRALYRLAATLDEETKPREAVEEFNKFIERYPEHPLADDAAFQVAFIDYRLSRAGNRERASQERARLAFEDFLARHPASAKVPVARHLLATLRDWETTRLTEAAKFYERRGDDDAAARTYRGALENDPGNPAAESLKRTIEGLESGGR
jgi:outer membrane protein assembly factor BamD